MDKYTIENLDLFYGDFKALKNIKLNIREKEITAFIGPSGCGKSTLLKTLNRMNDLCLLYTSPEGSFKRSHARVLIGKCVHQFRIFAECAHIRFDQLFSVIVFCLLYTSRCV